MDIIVVSPVYGCLNAMSPEIPPCWCYEVPAEKPQLPKKTLIIYDSTWPDEVEIHFEHLNDRVNAIIDYLKAREE